ncbi:hypothetical protein ACPPVT_03200 [Angustibacter sp. McL0619]|uniref:hypothetical protein n=1 Tax=Angustibacter sp. McL0619 TaxID=3415676 RepID=UPI003CF2D4ED
MSALPHPIVGAWVVEATGAPFAYHGMLFHADGTMLQSNPDAGHADSSDSAGVGVWRADGSVVRGRFAEFLADRKTHLLLGRRDVTFVLTVDLDGFSGTCRTHYVDPKDSTQSEAIEDGTMTGLRLRV